MSSVSASMWGVDEMPTVSLPWEQKLVSACICLILVVAVLDLRIGSSNLKRSPALDTYFYKTLG